MLYRVCYVTVARCVRDFIWIFVTTEHPPSRQDTHRHSTAGMESGCKLGNTRPGRAEMLSWAAPVQTQDTRQPAPTSHPATYHSLCRNSGQTRSWPQVISYQATPSTARQGVAGQIFMDQFWRLRSLRSGQNTALQSFTRFSPATVCIGLSLFIELSSILTQPCMTNCSIIEQ